MTRAPVPASIDQEHALSSCVVVIQTLHLYSYSPSAVLNTNGQSTKKVPVVILVLDPSVFAGMYRTLQKRRQEVRRDNYRQNVSRSISFHRHEQ